MCLVKVDAEYNGSNACFSAINISSYNEPASYDRHGAKDDLVLYLLRSGQGFQARIIIQAAHIWPATNAGTCDFFFQETVPRGFLAIAMHLSLGRTHAVDDAITFSVAMFVVANVEEIPQFRWKTICFALHRDLWPWDRVTLCRSTRSPECRPAPSQRRQEWGVHSEQSAARHFSWDITCVVRDEVHTRCDDSPVVLLVHWLPAKISLRTVSIFAVHLTKSLHSTPQMLHCRGLTVREINIQRVPPLRIEFR
ncbi:hypothetical protein CPB85DRAFT_1491106 [Mucidula mucida]|nr:hypothetical protein CPB85DRAFT_1491106 [Mucidula mucida]